jgi:hypothetical protein
MEEMVENIHPQESWSVLECFSESQDRVEGLKQLGERRYQYFERVSLGRGQRRAAAGSTPSQ